MAIPINSDKVEQVGRLASKFDRAYAEFRTDLLDLRKDETVEKLLKAKAEANVRKTECIRIDLGSSCAIALWSDQQAPVFERPQKCTVDSVLDYMMELRNLQTTAQIDQLRRSISAQLEAEADYLDRRLSGKSGN